ncbi:hypothetical protein [Micromonospora polyrhachis]|uniref:HEAT repeat protein n=1 Tax=Micromonospora polyrhachis TaxID=1282883 RepID=A0A7W7SK58_9ACTN|nr:hypothetical protein [Micromonospora polyrhachis]MBB4956290.1 hypothetical protein [Micromonospora polyrhachis]
MGIRTRAAEAACREAVWTRRPDVLQRLARSARAEVRVVALTGLVRVGQDAYVAGYLDDDAPLVRAVARDATRRLGVDVREHYRTAVNTDVPALGAIAGLAETGSAADAPLLRRMLDHPSSRVRVQAVRGLRLLDEIRAADVVLVRDPSPAVVREATLALRPLVSALPSGLPWELLANDRMELRRAGYRLLRGCGIDIELCAALILAVDAEPRLAERGRADATRITRDVTRTAWHYASGPELPVTAAKHAELVALASRAAEAIGEETSRQLIGWLANSRPGE